jgi:Fe-S cluster assembly iron-binding protein IscA
METITDQKKKKIKEYRSKHSEPNMLISTVVVEGTCGGWWSGKEK